MGKKRRKGKKKKTCCRFKLPKTGGQLQPTGINGRCRDLMSFETASADCSDDAVE